MQLKSVGYRRSITKDLNRHTLIVPQIDPFKYVAILPAAKVLNQAIVIQTTVFQGRGFVTQQMHIFNELGFFTTEQPNEKAPNDRFAKAPSIDSQKNILPEQFNLT
ncbi:hypothetical protein M513_01415 [Trichuris suis]|uniref:Uncharacterized protein n=1 Tax=Trichuris suis TaxID=68888 RepID=A0A085MKJ9_9BILA|nr:hypothetical protein M513_01415 [Trichuris suis]